MRVSRINSALTSAAVKRLFVSWPGRYGLAVALAGLAYAVTLFFRQFLDAELYLLPFGTVLVTSLVGGWDPGLLATALAVAVSYQASGRELHAAELFRLAIEGTVVSIVGGTLRVERTKAREREKVNTRLEQQILEIGDEERRRIGHDLHDGLGQHLTGISLLSETMGQQLAAGTKLDPSKVEMITRLVSEAVGITRDLARSLSPVTLERDGLAPAIEELAHTSSSLLGVQCTSEYDLRDLVLDRARSLHLYRIVQEAVNNSVRHGKAKNVRIELARDGTNVVVTVVDDGIGLSANTVSNPGLGLRIMQYRARIVGASLNAERLAPEGGTIVTCVCPLSGNSGES